MPAGRERVPLLQHFYRARRRSVPLEPGRVHLDAADAPRQPQPHDRPVVPGAAAAAGLPAVVHASWRARQDQVVPRSEEHVARGDDESAVLKAGQVDFLFASQLFRLRRHRPVQPESGDAAVRVDVELHVREALVSGH